MIQVRECDEREKVEATLLLLREYAERAASQFDDREPPLAGRCVELALAVRAVFGGEIVGVAIGCDCVEGCDACEAAGAGHYWNRLPNGAEYDLTSDQFGGDGLHPYPAFRDAAHIQPMPVLTALDKLHFIGAIAKELSPHA